MTKLLSIDSSLSSTGWALFLDGKYLRSGCIDLKKYSGDKLPEMIRRIYTLINSELPDIVVAEEMVVVRNPATARSLTMILGAIYAKCVENKVYCEFMRPSVWRKYVKSAGEKLPKKRDELKVWSLNKVKELFGVSDINDDVSDSILIGQSYINMYVGIKGEEKK